MHILLVLHGTDELVYTPIDVLDALSVAVLPTGRE
jgi:hypothetical protein